MGPKFPSFSASVFGKLLESTVTAKTSARSAVESAVDKMRRSSAQVREQGLPYPMKDKLNDFRARRWVEKEWRKLSVVDEPAVAQKPNQPTLHQVNDLLSAAFTRPGQSKKKIQWQNFSKETLNKHARRYALAREKFRAELDALQSNDKLAQDNPVEFMRKGLELTNQMKRNGHKLASLNYRASVARS